MISGRLQLADMIIAQLPYQIRRKLLVTLLSDPYGIAPRVRLTTTGVPRREWTFNLALQRGPDGSWIRSKITDIDLARLCVEV